jgi:hypothetical protein
MSKLTKYSKAFYYSDKVKKIYRSLKRYCDENNINMMDKYKFKQFYEMIEPMISNKIPFEYKQYKEYISFNINK